VALQGGKRAAAAVRNVCTSFRHGRDANKHQIKAKGKVCLCQHETKHQQRLKTKEEPRTSCFAGQNYA